MADPRVERVVSVVIPVRNEADSIAATVRAVLEQAAVGWKIEVVVVDDDSTDGTGEHARSAGARVVRMPHRAEGGNPAAARNRGAGIATGDPIVFLDADCFPRPGLAACPARGARAGSRGGWRFAGPSRGSAPFRALRLLLWLVPCSLPPPSRFRSQPSAGESQRSPSRVSEHERICRAAAHRLCARGASLAGRACRARSSDLVRTGRRSGSPQSTRLPQPPAAQLPLGVQRDRKQSRERCGPLREALPPSRIVDRQQRTACPSPNRVHCELLAPRPSLRAALHAADGAFRPPRVCGRDDRRRHPLAAYPRPACARHSASLGIKS